MRFIYKIRLKGVKGHDRSDTDPFRLLHLELLLEPLLLHDDLLGGELAVLLTLLGEGKVKVVLVAGLLGGKLALQLGDALVGVGDERVQLILCHLVPCHTHGVFYIW